MRIFEYDVFNYKAPYDAICVPINTNITRQNKLVMGKGFALEIKKRSPGIDIAFAESLKLNMNACFAYSDMFFSGIKLIGFISKLNWWEKSTMDILVKSAHELMGLCSALNLQNVLLPAPGCGCGGLNIELVKTTLDGIVDDRIIFCDGKPIR
jgi:hypothetical protein